MAVGYAKGACMTDTGGPAFPCEQQTNPGMTPRDYFAAKAMQSYLRSNDRDSFTFDDWAAVSYAMADAMLRAREEK